MSEVLDLRQFPEKLHKEFEGESECVLWCKGDSRLLGMPLASVVGTRDVSPEGVRRTKKLTTVLVNEGFCIVSGLAKGVDRVAHETALEMDAFTIAVMGTPIDECYPAEHQELKERIADRGLVLSQFAPGTPVRRNNFPQRNVLMAKLSLTTFVVEAQIDSGTKHQVRAAIRMGKKVAFLASLVNQDYPWVREALDAGFGVVIDRAEDAVSLLREIKPRTSDVSAEIPAAPHQDEFVFLIETKHESPTRREAKFAAPTPESPHQMPVVTMSSDIQKPVGMVQRIWRLIFHHQG